MIVSHSFTAYADYTVSKKYPKSSPEKSLKKHTAKTILSPYYNKKIQFQGKHVAVNDSLNSKIQSQKISKIDKSDFKKVPILSGITGYINTNPDEIKTITKNKVVLYDFWTYSCSNCQATTPYLKSWYDKYADKGLVIIGIHYPEFQFEKDINNVKQAVVNNGIKFPVVLDNDGVNWDAFGNNYWPRFYLADAEGYIRYDHIGEGAYDETENTIKSLLQENNSS